MNQAQFQRNLTVEFAPHSAAKEIQQIIDIKLGS
jgi:hypothetical protein